MTKIKSKKRKPLDRQVLQHIVGGRKKATRKKTTRKKTTRRSTDLG
ncbi:MAG: hypothetical protein ACYTGP_12005 [Planctomycetota bacterium]|jgi:hypothetical protein